MNLEIVIAILPLIIPYGILGENLSNLILAILACIYLIKSKKKIKIDKYFYLISILSITAFITQIIISRNIESLSGLYIYINVNLYYLTWKNIFKDKNKDKLLKYMVLSIVIVSVISIITQGFYLDIRINGNIGYANSYALLLLIGIYINKLREEDKLSDIIDSIFVLGIFYTGSRTTIILLIAYYLYLLLYEYKKNKKEIVYSLEPFILGVIQYLIYSNVGLFSLIIIPIYIIIYNYIKNEKWRKYLYYIGIILGAIAMFFSSSNTFERLRNISLNNGSFQERLVFFEDSIKSIFNNPLGHGINTFQYKLYDNASAFYDVKYVHNSVLQTSYDIGIIGGLLILIIFIYGIIKLFKSNESNRNYFILLYISIFIHSLMDFDFSYSTLIILWVLVIALINEDNKEIINRRIAYIPVIALATFLLLYEGTLLLGEKAMKYNLNSFAENCFNVANKISFQLDYRGYYNEAQLYKNLYDENKNENNLLESLDLLKTCEKINKDDPRILWNISYIYEKLGDADNTEKYMELVLEKEKYYKEAYIRYQDYLIKAYGKINDNKYVDKLNNLENYYYESYNSLNNKAIYMKNQLKENYDDIRDISIDYNILLNGKYKDTITYYDQKDTKWNDISYPTKEKNVGEYGCGAVSMAIVQATLNNSNITPIEMVNYSLENGYCENGTKREFFTDVVKEEKYKLNLEKYSSTEISKVKRLLSDGNHVAIAIMKPGNFTKEGHYIVLNGIETIDGYNYFNVVDCNKNNDNYKNNGNLIVSEPKNGIVKARTNIFQKECDEYWVYSKN
ncbi:hypothetical protein UT300007_01830 [Clostridium sp. CTA-7]